jgi:FKBP-type peptidyl-prolyl cis-trans isomerase FkpA
MTPAISLVFSLGLLAFPVMCEKVALQSGQGNHGLRIRTIEPSTHICHSLVGEGDIVNVTYVLTYHEKVSGKVMTLFDNTGEKDRPETIVVGKRRSLRGIEEGIRGMCKKERRALTIPPAMGFGNADSEEGVPAGTMLYANITVVSIIPKVIIIKLFTRVKKI